MNKLPLFILASMLVLIAGAPIVSAYVINVSGAPILVTYNSFRAKVTHNYDGGGHIDCYLVYSRFPNMSPSYMSDPVDFCLSGEYSDYITSDNMNIATVGKTVYYYPCIEYGGCDNENVSSVTLKPGVGTKGAGTGINLTYTFYDSSLSRTFYLVDEEVTGCTGHTSAILDQDGTVLACYDETLVEDRSYSIKTTGYTASGNVQETGTIWFKKTSSPISGLSNEFALFIALFIMMFTALMAGPSTAPAVAMCVTFEGWIFYALNMLAGIDNYIPAIGSFAVPAALTVMTFFIILWNFTEHRRKNK